MKQKNTTESETSRMKCLACAPGIIFMLVASADGEIDKKELRRFATLMASKDYAILASLLEQSGATISDLLDEVLANKLDPYQELQSVCSILDLYLSEQAALTYKLTLLRLANGIAKSTGAVFGLFGGKINQEQQTAITVIANLLGLLEEDDIQTTVSENLQVNSIRHRNYSDVSNIPDTLFPALKSADWAEKINTDAVTRPVYQQANVTQKDPVIAYAEDLPEMVEFLESSFIQGTLSVEQIHTKAMRNLENRLNDQVEWKELEFDTGDTTVGTVSGLILTGDYYCSEALISETLLNRAHQRMKTDLLMAITPVRGELYITKLVSEEQHEPERLMFAQLAVTRYFSSDQVQISPNIWIVRNGKIAGYVPGMEEIIESAKQSVIPSTTDKKQLIHSAKTYSEAKGTSIEIDVVAKDIGDMIAKLQHVIRSYVDQGVKQKSFSGKLRVQLNIQDPDYDPEMKSSISEQLSIMSDFMCRQFSSLGIKTVNNSDIKLDCSVIN